MVTVTAFLNFEEHEGEDKLVAELLTQPFPGVLWDREIALQPYFRPRIVEPIAGAIAQVLATPIVVKEGPEKETTGPLINSLNAHTQRIAKLAQRCAVIELKLIAREIEPEYATADLEGVEIKEIQRVLDLEYPLILKSRLLDETQLALALRYILRKSDVQFFSIGDGFSGESQVIILNWMLEKLREWHRTKYSKPLYITSKLTPAEELELQGLSQFALKCYPHITKEDSKLDMNKEEITAIFKAITGMLDPQRIVL